MRIYQRSSRLVPKQAYVDVMELCRHLHVPVLVSGDGTKEGGPLHEAEALASALVRDGYADAKANPRRVVVDHAAFTVAPEYHIASGALVRLDGVRLTSQGRTNPAWVAGLAPWNEGDRYDPEMVAELERRLLDTGVSLQNIRVAVEALRLRAHRLLVVREGRVLARRQDRLGALVLSDRPWADAPAEAVALAARYESRRFDDDLNSRTLAGAVTLDARAEWAVNDRALVYVASKWDLEDEPQSRMAKLKGMAEDKLPQLKGSPFVALSSHSGRGVERLMPAVLQAYDTWSVKVKTKDLNTWLSMATQRHPPPAVDGKRIVGAVGVVGPTRINYRRIIPVVDYTAGVIGRLLG